MSRRFRRGQARRAGARSAARQLAALCDAAPARALVPARPTARSAMLAPALRAAIALALATAAHASALPGHAQTDWLERDADELVLLFRRGGEDAADALARTAPAGLEMLETLFSTRLPRPFTLRLYASASDWRADHPLAQEVDGRLYPIPRPRREASLVAAGDPAALQGEVRLAFARQLAAHASEGRMPALPLEGVARFLARAEGDEPAISAGVARLREAQRRDALLPWSDLASAGAAYRDPELAHPQALSIAHFLAETRGLDALAAWPAAFAAGATWRATLEEGFGTAPETLEADWRAWLPRYLDGGWRLASAGAEGLGHAEALIAQGRYEEARLLLAGALDYLEQARPEDAPAMAALLARAEAGRDATSARDAALRALEDGDYGAAAAAVSSVEGGAPVPEALAAELSDLGLRAAEGRRARADLDRAASLPAWRPFAARLAARDAAVALSALGNELVAAEALALREAANRRIRPAALALVALGLALLAGNAWRRRGAPDAV